MRFGGVSVLLAVCRVIPQSGVLVGGDEMGLIERSGGVMRTITLEISQLSLFRVVMGERLCQFQPQEGTSSHYPGTR